MGNYIIDYSVCSFFYLSVLLFFFVRQRHLVTIRTKIFKVALVLTFLSVLLDIAAAVTDWYAIHIPIFVLNIVNALFLISSALVPLMFFIYVLALCRYETGNKLKKRWVIFIPVVITIILVIIPFFNTTWGAFYIDPETHKYMSGKLHMGLYIVAATYFTLGSSLIILNHNLKKSVKFSTLTFVILAIVAMSLQLFMPRYLFNETANCLSMIIIYFAIEQPSLYIDNDVGAFNEKGLDEYTFQLFNNHVPFSTVFVSVRSYSIIKQKYGQNAAQEIIKDLFKKLYTNFKYGTIFYCRDNTFCIIFKNTNFIEQSLDKFHEDFSKQYIIKNSHISSNIKIACINSDVTFNTYEQYQEIVNNVFSKLQNDSVESQNVLMIDDEFTKEVDKQNKYEIALLDAIKRNSIEVYYQPIISTKTQQVESVEALARLKDPDLGDIPPSIFIKIAEDNGLITILGEQIFTKVVKFIAEGELQKYGVHQVSINFSLAQCLESNVTDRYLAIAKRYNINPEMISIEITEKETKGTIKYLQKAVDGFVNAGFKVALDDLGTGFSSFTYLQNLPFSIIKIDRQMLQDAMKNKKNKQRFVNVIEFAKSINVNCVCEDVENEKQALFLKELGVNTHQGFLYSHPLFDKELIKYIQETNKQGKKKN